MRTNINSCRRPRRRRVDSYEASTYTKTSVAGNSYPWGLTDIQTDAKTEPLDAKLLAEMRACAVDMARRAGAILSGYFGQTLEVEYKDKDRRDPVTNVDKESQEFLKRAISERFPDHSILGEEDEEDDAPARDIVWVLDPLDGTRNYMSGLPVYACSIGVMYLGSPIVGALFIPWPSEGGGVVIHASKDGGACVEQEPISLAGTDGPRGSALATFPASFGGTYRFPRSTRDKVGEVRVTGSIAYEMAMAAKGAVQYSVITGPHLWDVVGGAIIVLEAGGLVMRGRRPRGLKAMLRPVGWEPAESLVPSWDRGGVTMNDLRRWSEPLVVGNPGAVRFVIANMQTRLPLRYRLSRVVRGFKRR